MKAPEILGRRAAVVALCLGSMLLYIDFGTTSVESVAAKKETSPASKHTRSTADRWPMWGDGPGRNMANRHAKNLPYRWDVETGENIKWKAPLGSQSYGNPVVGDGRVLIGTNNEGKRNPAITDDKGIVMCFRQSDGKFLWQAVHDKLSSNKVNDWPEQGICSTGVVENGKYYYVSNRAELVCADLEGFKDGENDGPYRDEKYTSSIDGDFIWILDMINEYGVFPHNLATSSPLIIGDLVYINTSNGVERDHITVPNPRAPSFIAVNKNTGELAWESNEPGEGILHGQWSCPTWIRAAGKEQILFPGGDGWLYSFEPKKGELLWKFDLNPKDAKWELGGLGTRNNILSTAVAVGDTVYLAVGQDPEHLEGIGHLYSINAAGAKGDVTKTAQNWHYGGEDYRRTVSTVAATDDGLLYAADLSGFLHCLDAKTGKKYWIHDTLAAIWGSPTVIDGKVFLGDEDGDIVVLKHGKVRKVLAEMNMGHTVYSTPVAVGDTLYITNRRTLFAISTTGRPKSSNEE
ncbi:MAG: PQQ-binding-like beta-propeller repeat protein [Planctomycetota bacterium]